MLISDGVSLAAEITAYARSLDGELEANSSTVSLDLFVGYTKVADRYQYDLFVTFPLTWNTTAGRYELFRAAPPTASARGRLVRDSFVTFPLTWNTTSRRNQLFRAAPPIAIARGRIFRDVPADL